MTKQKLNRDIKKLNNLIKKEIQKRDNNSKESENWYKFKYEQIKPEFERLYNADSNFEYMSKKSILIMIGINIKYRFIRFHNFGLHIDLEKL